MYKLCWPAIEEILRENNVVIQYDGDKKAIGAVSKDNDNDLSFSLSDGKISSIKLRNNRVQLDFETSNGDVNKMNFVRLGTLAIKTKSNN